MEPCRTLPPMPCTVPLAEYGRQKARAEARLCSRGWSRGCRSAVLRLARGRLARYAAAFADWSQKLAAGQPNPCLQRHDDQAPVETAMACDAIAMLMKDGARGVFQLTGPRDLPYLEIGRHVASELAVSARRARRRRRGDRRSRPAGRIRGGSIRHSNSSRLRRRVRSCSSPDVLAVVDSVVAAKRTKKLNINTASERDRDRKRLVAAPESARALPYNR